MQQVFNVFRSAQCNPSERSYCNLGKPRTAPHCGRRTPRILRRCQSATRGLHRGILKPFLRIRKRRNEVKCHTSTSISATPDELTAEATNVLAIIDMATQVLEHMPVY